MRYHRRSLRNFITSVAETVLRESFESVGHFFWPLYFDESQADKIISLSVANNEKLYLEKLEFLRKKGLALYEFLKGCNSRSDFSKTKMDVFFRGAMEANTEAAFIVRGFIFNPNGSLLLEQILHVWFWYSAKDSRALKGYERHMGRFFLSDSPMKRWFYLFQPKELDLDAWMDVVKITLSRLNKYGSKSGEAKLFLMDTR